MTRTGDEVSSLIPIKVDNIIISLETGKLSKLRNHKNRNSNLPEWVTKLEKHFFSGIRSYKQVTIAIIISH